MGCSIVVGVLPLSVGEVGRTPARDGLADELLGRDHHGERGEQRARVATRQPLHQPVVVGRAALLAPLGLLDAHQQTQQTVHPATSSNSPPTTLFLFTTVNLVICVSWELKLSDHVFLTSIQHHIILFCAANTIMLMILINQLHLLTYFASAFVAVPSSSRLIVTSSPLARVQSLQATTSNNYFLVVTATDVLAYVAKMRVTN